MEGRYLAVKLMRKRRQRSTAEACFQRGMAECSCRMAADAVSPKKSSTRVAIDQTTMSRAAVERAAARGPAIFERPTKVAALTEGPAVRRMKAAPGGAPAASRP